MRNGDDMCLCTINMIDGSDEEMDKLKRRLVTSRVTICKFRASNEVNSHVVKTKLNQFDSFDREHF